MLLKKFFLAFSILLGLLAVQPAQAHGDSHDGDLPEAPHFVDPLTSGTVYYGNSIPEGNGFIRTFVKADELGNPTDLGYHFSKSALTGLPTTPVYPTATQRLFPPLPEGAPETAFKHVEYIYWSQGHDPALSGIADLAHAHVDFTFFFITNEERDTICPNPDVNNPVSPYVCQGEELAKVLQPPPEGAIPTDYIQVPEFVTFYGLQRAGTAYFDPSDPLDPFTQTVFYGFNEGELSYIDVPISIAFLEEFAEQEGGACFSREIKQPRGGIYPRTGYYPTKYDLCYNSETEEYTMSVGGLTAQVAASVPEPTSTLSLFAISALMAVAKLKSQKMKD